MNARPIDRRCWKLDESDSNVMPFDTRYCKNAWYVVNAGPMDRTEKTI